MDLATWMSSVLDTATHGQWALTFELTECIDDQLLGMLWTTALMPSQNTSWGFCPLTHLTFLCDPDIPRHSQIEVVLWSIS